MKVTGNRYHPTPEEAETIVDFLGCVLSTLEIHGRDDIRKDELSHVQLYNMMVAAKGKK